MVRESCAGEVPLKGFYIDLLFRDEPMYGTVSWAQYREQMI